jgi:diguanylate cyclase (GGDEF)-like protein
MRILIASEDAVATGSLEKLAGQAGMDVVSLSSGRDVLGQLRAKSAPDLVILDWLLPGSSGLELVERMRADDRWRNAIIVLLAHDSDSAAMRQASQCGADDCIRKPLNDNELSLHFNLWHKLARLQQTVNQGSSHDAVTGLYSHGLVLETAQHELDRSIREETPLSMIMTDIDNLRQVNDKYGHQMGDKVLAGVAEQMRIALRSYDLSGRYGGEEFLTVLPRCGRANALEVGERIRRAIAAEPFRIDSITLPVTVSLGVVTTMGDEDVTARKMIRAADHALFKAKREGRNRVEMAVSLKTWAGRSI